LDRLLALQQQQGLYQPPQGFGVANDQTPAGGSINQPAPVLPSQSGTAAMTPLPSPGVANWPSTGQPAPASPTPDRGPPAYIRVGDYLMPQFGPIDAPQTAQPPSHDLGDRLWAGFQSWAHTPVGNPFAALANGIAGFKSGQYIEPAAVQQNLVSRAEIPQP